MAIQMRWTDDRIHDAVRTVKALGSVTDAASHLSEKWGVQLSRSAVRHALISNGFNIETLLKEGRAEAAHSYGPETEPLETVEADLGVDLKTPSHGPIEGLAWQSYRPNPNYKVPDFPAPSKVEKGKVQRGVIIPDTHVPLMNKKAWGCMLGILKDWNPDFGVIIGDFLDLESLSRHPKSKPDLVKLSSEYYAGNIALDAIQNNSQGCDWTYIEGNHEYRAKRFCSEFGVLDGLLDVPEQLFINPRADAYHRSSTGLLRGMRWVSIEDQPYINAHSAYYHGHHRTNKFHSAWHAEIYCPSKANFKPLFYGHMHTFQQFTAENGCSAQCVGFLGDEGALHYTMGKPTSWTLGLVLQEVSDTGVMTYQTVRIVNGKAVYNGKTITG